MINFNSSLKRDEWLALFTDQALEGKIADQSVAALDPEMRGLVDVVLRLNDPFFQKNLDASTVKRMQVEVLARWRKEQHSRQNSWTDIFRLEWLNHSKVGQFAGAVAMVAIVGMLILSFPGILSSGDSMTGSAGLQPGGAFLWTIPLAAILAMSWLLRRKP